MERADWNRKYAGAELVWTAQPNRFLVEEVSELAPGRALDLAAGEGRNAVWLAERGWRVTAVDFSDVAIDKARGLASARGVDVDWLDADLRRWSPPAALFDLVIVLYLHLPWRDFEPVLERAASAVAPRGTFLLVGHDSSNLERGHGGPQDAGVLYTPEQVAEVVGRQLEIEKASRVERPVETQAGTAVAIDCRVRARRS